MRVSLAWLIRLTSLSGLGLCVVAVGLGRMTEPESEGRAVTGSDQVAIPPFAQGHEFRDVRILDYRTGEVHPLRLPEGEQLQHAQLSPWRDERGESQVVGLWTRRTGEGTNLVAREFGLARFRYPSGEAIERVPISVFPNSPPCWFPDNSASVLFAGTDGYLYRFAFDADSGGDTPKIRRLIWLDGSPRGPFAMSDPYWPTSERLRRLVFASVDTAEAGRLSTERRIWWVRLDRTATKIEAAGPLTSPRGTTERIHERYPVVSSTSSGGLVMGYLAQRPGRRTMALHVVPLLVDEASGDPRAITTETKVLAEGCLPVAPTISRDRHSISCVVAPQATPKTLPIPSFESLAGGLQH